MAGPLGSAPGIMVGVGVGTAASVALEPLVEPGRQQAWSDHPNRVHNPALVAQLVAQGAITLANGRGQAKREGVNGARFEQLVYLAQRAPDLALTLELWRRGRFGPPDPANPPDEVTHALAKEQLERRYWPAILDLFNDRLSPQVAALAIVRGLMRDTGNFLPVGPPSTEGKIAAFPVSGLDPLEEARANGIDPERLAVLTGIQGRPMGPEAAAAATFRGILDRVDYDRAISEGDIRNEWADAIFETARQIPSVADYVNARIRGWITVDEMNAGVARHGMSPEDAHLLYLRTGRPAAPGQMATAAARGIDGPDGRPMDRAQFLKGIAESDIRPEWGEMLWESRYLYPPLFQLTRLVQAGAITADTAREWAVKDRYPPEVVNALHAYWSQPTSTAKANPRETLARTQAVAALKRRYIAEQTDTQGVIDGLALLGETVEEAGRIAELWALEKGWTEKQLTPAQVKKAYRAGEYSQDEAVAQLVLRHFAATDALTYLTT